MFNRVIESPVNGLPESRSAEICREIERILNAATSARLYCASEAFSTSISCCVV